MTTGKSCAKARLMNGLLGSSKERKEAKQWGVGGGGRPAALLALGRLSDACSNA